MLNTFKEWKFMNSFIFWANVNWTFFISTWMVFSEHGNSGVVWTSLFYHLLIISDFTFPLSLQTWWLWPRTGTHWCCGFSSHFWSIPSTTPGAKFQQPAGPGTARSCPQQSTLQTGNSTVRLIHNAYFYQWLIVIIKWILWWCIIWRVVHIRLSFQWWKCNLIYF